MNAAHLHLMFTHLPVIGLLIAVMVNVYGLFRQNEENARIILLLYALAGFFGIIAYFTGDGAEELLEGKLGYAESVIEPHETWALIFFIGLSILAILSVIRIFFLKKTAFTTKCYVVFLCIALAISVLAVGTALTGGEIRHTENVEVLK